MLKIERADHVRKAQTFRALHVRGTPLVLFNVWDGGSAKAVEAAGARAIATGSWSVAHANGFEDGEQLPREVAIENLARIVGATELPVSVDLEAGYGLTPREVGETIRLAIEAGAVGCNFEDSFPESGDLRAVSAQAERVHAAREAADSSIEGFFINARTDVFFQASPEEHTVAMADEAIERAHAYAAAGADGIFVPGVEDLQLIARITSAVPLPINIMAGEGTPPTSELARVGVARVSYGPIPYRIAMNALGQAAREALASATNAT
jgi:methylisocitrate lyase